MESIEASRVAVSRVGAPQQPSPSARRDDIQGLRAVAVLAVVIFHAGLWLPGGYVGVDIFFVISGFVITAMLQREYSAHGRVRFAHFYVRRFKRLTPALALMTLVTIVGSVIILAPVGPQESAAKTVIGALLLAANVVIARTTGGYFGQNADVNPLLHTWSLSVEEQFYVVFPALLVAGWVLGARRGSKQTGAVVGVVFAGLISIVLAMIGAGGRAIPLLPEVLVGFYGPATRVWEFAAGALLALGAVYLRRVSSTGATGLGIVGGLGVLASVWLIDAETPFPGPWTLLPVVATVMLLAAGSRENPVSRALASRPMVRIGDLSYSLYLWHWPFIVFATLLWPESSVAPVLAAATSVIPAWASYTLVEQPIRTTNFTHIGFVRLVAVTVLPPLVLAAAVLIAAEKGYWNPTVQRYQDGITAHHAGMATGCTEEAWARAEDCTTNAQSEGAPIYLVGDSNADHFREALDGTGLALDRPVVGLTQDGCAFLSRTGSATHGGDSEDCPPYPLATAEYLSGATAGTVVVANSYLGWRLGSSDSSASRHGLSPAEAPAALANLEQDLARTVIDLQQSGHEVVLVQPVPHWGGAKEELSWAGCSVGDMLFGTCRMSMPLSEALEPAKGARGVVSAVSAKTGARTIDLAEEICPDVTCRSVAEDGMVRYRDATHISVPQSEALVQAFTAELARSGRHI